MSEMDESESDSQSQQERTHLLNLRPSYMDNGVSNAYPEDPNAGFDASVKRKLADILDYEGDDDDMDETGFCIPRKIQETDQNDDTIKTYLRLRPPKEARSTVGEGPSGFCSFSDAYKIIDRSTVTVSSNTQKKVNGIGDTSEACFKFTHIFDPTTNQATVYEESTTELVSSFLNGHNALLFSYGATNSGKTYTMQGYGKEFGIVPRTLETLFLRLDDNIYAEGDIKPSFFDSCVKLEKPAIMAINAKKQNLIKFAKVRQAEISDFFETMSNGRGSMSVASLDSINTERSSFSSHTDISANPLPQSDTNIPILYAVWVSFAEIYNERIYDLFEPLAKGKKTRKELKLYTDKQNRVYIKDLNEFCVNTAPEAYRLFVAGKKNLQLASTNVNSTSSRSHSFFNVRIVRLERSGDDILPRHVCRFTFCDLAGVERVTQTGNVGVRLKESGNINQSVGVLIRCIRALRTKQLGGVTSGVIPYRDSKLARLFQSYLNTGTKVCMIVNVNPTTDLIETNLQILHNSAIASQVKTFCPVAYPVANVDNSFSKRVRASIGAQHRILQVDPIVEGEEEKSDLEETISDEEGEGATNTVKKVSTIVRRIPVTVHDENKKLMEENLALKRKVMYIEQEIRESMQHEVQKLLTEQREYYENLVKEQKSTTEKFTKRRISIAAQLQRQIESKTPKVEAVSETISTTPPRTVNDTTSTMDPYCTPDSLNSGGSGTPGSLLRGTSIEEYRRELRKAKAENDEMVEVIRTLREHITQLSNDEMESKLKLQEKDDLIKSLTEKVTNLTELVQIQKEQKEAINVNSESESSADVASLLEKLAEAKDKIIELNDEIQQGVELVTSYDLNIMEANQKLQKLTEEYNKLNEEHETLKEDHKYLNFAMEQMQSKEN